MGTWVTLNGKSKYLWDGMDYLLVLVATVTGVATIAILVWDASLIWGAVS